MCVCEEWGGQMTNLVGIDFVQFDDVRVALAEAKKFDLVASIDFLAKRDDLHGEFLLCSTISAAAERRDDEERSETSEDTHRQIE